MQYNFQDVEHEYWVIQYITENTSFIDAKLL